LLDLFALLKKVRELRLTRLDLGGVASFSSASASIA
jgi:hypothetical protein